MGRTWAKFSTLPANNHIYIVKSLFTSRDDYFKNLREANVLACEMNISVTSQGAYVVNESPVRLSGCKGATYINVLRRH